MSVLYQTDSQNAIALLITINPGLRELERDFATKLRLEPQFFAGYILQDFLGNERRILANNVEQTHFYN